MGIKTMIVIGALLVIATIILFGYNTTKDTAQDLTQMSASELDQIYEEWCTKNNVEVRGNRSLLEKPVCFAGDQIYKLKESDGIYRLVYAD